MRHIAEVSAPTRETISTSIHAPSLALAKMSTRSANHGVMLKTKADFVRLSLA
jgi:hypothetical protein